MLQYLPSALAVAAMAGARRPVAGFGEQYPRYDCRHLRLWSTRARDLCGLLRPRGEAMHAA